MTLIRAAGGLVVREGSEVVLVHRPAYDDWSFPKGKLEAGEEELAAALREVEEETSLSCSVEEDLGAVTYIDARGRLKIVRYWRMSAPQGAMPEAANEVDVATWVPVGEAEQRLSYPHDRELLRRLTGDPVDALPVPVYVVRHVKAGSRKRWKEFDELRPMSDAGRRQAQRLVRNFEGLALTRLFSSPFLRCVQTLEPLAEDRGLEIELALELNEGASPAGAEALALAAAVDGPAALSTHGDVQQLLVEDLLDRGITLLGGEVAFAKGCTWVLDVLDGKVTSARYEAPPSSR